MENKAFPKGTFYISLGKREDNQNIPELLRHVAREISANPKQPVSILAMALLLPDDRSDAPTMVVDYNVEDAESISMTERRKNWAKELKVATDPGSIILAIPLEDEPIINRLTYRLPQGDTQDNYVALLNGLADYLDEINQFEPIDLVLVDISDADAIDRPEIHVTLRKK